MKLLKIENQCGHYRKSGDSFESIDKVCKEDLLTLVATVLEDGSVEFDEYDEALIKNQAHQIIYKSIFRKLKSLKERRQEFIDQSARLFIDDYERYRDAGKADSA